MLRRIALVVALSGLSLAVGADGAGAAKPVPGTHLEGHWALHRVQLGARTASTPVCQLGEQSAVFAVNYILPPNDAYFTLLQPALCTACPGATGGYISRVHVALNFQVACSQPVEISVVAATGEPSCLVPDLLNVRCPAVPFDLVAPAPGDYEFELTLPEPCRFTDDAFLCVKFPEDAPACPDYNSRPQLLVSGQCEYCRSYNVYNGSIGSDELCAVGLPGNPAMWVDIDPCSFGAAAVDPTSGFDAPRIWAVMPNPGRGREINVFFTSPGSGGSRLELFDLLGHRIVAHDVSGMGSGMHQFDLARGVSLHPGLYVVRLVRGGKAVARKVTVIR